MFYPYPFGKFAVAEIDEAYGGGYGAQSLLCLLEAFFRTGLTQRNVKILAHEAAHQWWGHMVGFKDLYAGGTWLNEGFAEYSCLLYLEHKYGKEVMLENLRENGDIYLNVGFANPVDDKAITDPEVFESPIYSAIVYRKGSYIHHMLRYVLGDSVYFKAMSTYAHELYGRLATVEDFQEICERVSGRDLDWFFDEWLRDTGALCYSLQDFYASREGGCSAKVRFFQGLEIETPMGKLTTKVFNMPVDVTFHMENEDVTRRMRVDSSVCERTFELGSKPVSVEVDKDGWLLKADVEYQFPLSSLQAEASERGVTLSWKGPKMGWVSGYNIYRKKTSEGEFRRVNPRPVRASCYLDTTFGPGAFYYWTITALDSLDPGYESLYSNVVSNYPWLAYDDGTAENFNRVTGGCGAVRFTPDFYPVKIEKVKIYVYGTRREYPYGKKARYVSFEVCIWDDDGEGGTPGTLLTDPVEVAPSERGWFVVDLSDRNIVISDGEFYAGWRDLGDGIQIGNDNSDPTVKLRSWFSEGIGWEGYSGYVSMIRVQVAPVGGTEVVETSSRLPEEFLLLQNYPNPFNRGTIIMFWVPDDGQVLLKIYDLMGREVRTLVKGRLKAGEHAAVWDGRDDKGFEVASGVYIYRLMAGRRCKAKKMLLLK